jgi:hypothetical protein
MKGIRNWMPSTLATLKKVNPVVLHKELSRIASWGLSAALMVGVAGWFVSLPDGDIARYAAMSMELARTHDYINNPSAAAEPALLVWLSGLSMTIFGPNHMAYRIPGLLPDLIALYAVYRYAKSRYSAETAWLAALILGTTRAMFLMSQEVGPENFLAAFFMFSFWQLAEYWQHRKLRNLVFCVAGTGLFILSKGSVESNDFQFTPFRLGINLLFGFAPYSLLVLLALWERIKIMVGSPSKTTHYERLSFYGLVIPFILLSLNPYQSERDGFILFPLAAVMVADFIIKSFYGARSKSYRWLYVIQVVLSYLVIAFLFSLVWFPFPDHNYYGLIHFMALLSALTWLVFFSTNRHKLVLSCTILAVGSNLILNSYYYPNLSIYRAGYHLGLSAREDGVQFGRFYSYQAGNSPALHFYSGIPVQQTNDFKGLVTMKNCWVYTRESFLDEFRALRPDLKIIGRCADLKTANPDLAFLDPRTRDTAIRQMVLIRL